jgi:LacI family transcriptional regulator, galactose operon repressor
MPSFGRADQEAVMSKRPTIADLAEAAGVSISTINRILNGSAKVRPPTMQRVHEAAEGIGFYDLGTIESRRRQIRPRRKLGFLLQQSHREVYRMFGANVVAAASRREDVEVDPLVNYVDRLSPETIAERLASLGRTADAIAVIAEDHPLIAHAIDDLKTQGVPVVAYITDQSAASRAGYVGTDNWKLGRTAAWFIAQTTHGAGPVAVFIGSHRYQCQEISDASFRSYIREHAPRLHVKDSAPTHEEPDNAYALVKELLQEETDLIGIYICGGGISGVLRALREAPRERREHIRLVCRDIGAETQRGSSRG